MRTVILSGAKNLAGLIAAGLLSGCAFFSDALDRPTPVVVTELERMPSCGAQGQGPEPKIHYFETAAAVNAWERGRNVPPTPIDAVVEGPFALIELGERGVHGYGLLISRNAVLHFGKRLVLQSTFFYGSQIGGKRAEESPCVLLALPPRHYNVVEMYDQEGVLRAKTDTERGMLAVKPSALSAPEAAPTPPAPPATPELPAPPETPATESPPAAEEPQPAAPETPPAEQNNEEQKQ